MGVADIEHPASHHDGARVTEGFIEDRPVLIARATFQTMALTPGLEPVDPLVQAFATLPQGLLDVVTGARYVPVEGHRKIGCHSHVQKSCTTRTT